MDGAWQKLLLVPMRQLRGPTSSRASRPSPRTGPRSSCSGGVASEAVYRLGQLVANGPIQWFVEGFATGLAVQQAILKLHRKFDQVVVCFSDGNHGPKVARAVSQAVPGFRRGGPR